VVNGYKLGSTFLVFALGLNSGATNSENIRREHYKFSII